MKTAKRNVIKTRESGRAVFSDLAMQQLKEGIFKTSTKTVEVVDTDGTKFKKKEIRVVYDENAGILQKCKRTCKKNPR